MKDPYANIRHPCYTIPETETDFGMTRADAAICKNKCSNGTCARGPRELKCKVTRHANLYRAKKEFEATSN
jgi:hypothetical protein